MLTQKAKYAIKALIYLTEKGGLAKTKEIAEKAKIPKKFLENILLDLKARALVSSHQGASGGYYLLRDASEINLAEVYRIFEGAVALVPCASELFYQPCSDCSDEEHCSIRKAMQHVRQQTLQALEQITIQKMADGECSWHDSIE